MIHSLKFLLLLKLLLLMLFPLLSLAEESQLGEPPFHMVPPVEPPYYRIRYPASTQPGELIFAVKYTLWIPPGIETIRGIIVHQHGCGEGSCKSGITGAWDLHWQALAEKHQCALLAPSYEQPQTADCQMWCDPRNGSAKTFLQALDDLGKQSNHRELAKVPWALWGHSGGGHWAGGMALLYPDRVAAVWLRSGVPLFESNPERPKIGPYELTDGILNIPIMCNPGTKEGVTVKTGRFARVWPANLKFLTALRAKNGLVGVAIDPLSAHECGNQRYLAIPWFNHCLSERLTAEIGVLAPMPTKEAWLAPFFGKQAIPAQAYTDSPTLASWLPNEQTAKLWMQYVKDTKLPDTTPPPKPTNIVVKDKQITWQAKADLESGIARFIIFRNGVEIGQVPEKDTNRFGRPIFQGLQYSDTPSQPLVKMIYIDHQAKPGTTHQYQVVSENTVGLRSSTSPE